MSNYQKENLLTIAPEKVPAGTLAVKVGDDIFTAGNVKITGTDVSATTATAPDVLEGKQFYDAQGVLTQGTLIPQSGGGTMDFYKCSEVNQETWNGYKAVLVTDTDGKQYYEFEKTLTEGLTYGKGITPVIDKIYDSQAMIRVDFIYEGNKSLFAEKFDGSFTHTFTHLGESPVFAEVDGRKCMLLDASHTFSHPSDGLPSGSSARTIAAWIYPKNNNSHGFYVFYGKHSPENSPAYMLGIHSYHHRFEILYENAFDFNMNQWYHIALTYENGQAKLYVNGELKKTVDRELTTITDNAEYPLTLGWFRGDAYFANNTNGYISDLQIHGYALSEAEIQSLANS